MSTTTGVFLYLYPIYYSPADFPGKWVLRRQAIMHGGEVVADGPGDEVVGDSVNEVRAALPPGLWRTSRQPGDVTSLVECWI